MTTTYWSPNQTSTAQVETATLTGAVAAGNTFSAAINGKTITYTAISGDTLALFATGLFNLLTVASPAEFNEITWTNPSTGVVVATAKVAGTPFANVPGTSAGLVFSTGGGFGGTLVQSHTTPNASPSDVNDAQNWLRAGVRALPQSTDDLVVNNSSVPLLWNLDQLVGVNLNSYTRWQSFTGTIGLPENNPLGYAEWRATYFKISGGSAALVVVLGAGSTGSGPTRERYDTTTWQTTMTVLGMGAAADEYGVRWKGTNAANTFTIISGSLGVAMLVGDVANLASSVIDGNAKVGIGQGVTWAAAQTLTMYGGTLIINSAPQTVSLNNGAQMTVTQDALTWTTITAQGGSNQVWLAGGTITTLTMSTSSNLDKSGDKRTLTITNATIDGDTCSFNDPLDAIVFSNAVTVKQQVTQGPFRFTGPKTVLRS